MAADAGFAGFLLVGLGGALGALARFGIGRWVAHRHGRHRFPVGTFLVNLTGAAALGVLHGLGAAGDAALLLADGFLGAYTTYSTFLSEGVGTRWRPLYLIGTLALGAAGYVAARLLATP